MKDTAVLLIDCPDRKGLVARVAGLLYEQGANILHADQHQDHALGLFFMRVEWSLDAGDGDAVVAFERAFTTLAAELEMHLLYLPVERAGSVHASARRWPPMGAHKPGLPARR